MISYMSNGNALIIPWTAGLIKNTFLYQMIYFPESYTHCKNKIKVESELSNYESKSCLKERGSIKTSKFAKTNLANLNQILENYILINSKLLLLI